MSTTIMDGTGSNTRAEVTQRNRLKTASLSTPAIGVFSAEGAAGNITSGPQDVTASVTDPIFWFQNNDATRAYVINRINVNWTGSGVVQVAFFDNGTVPTANHTEAGAGFLNLAATGTFPASGYKWDGVGTGMTVSDTGTPGGFIYAGPGNTSLNLESAVILPPGSTQTVAVIAPETARILVAYQGYFVDLDAL